MFSNHKQQTVTAPTTAKTEVRICNSYDSLASLGVVHPVQNDLWCPVPTGHHVARHLGISTACQAKVQDLIQKQTSQRTMHSRHTVNSLFKKKGFVVICKIYSCCTVCAGFIAVFCIDVFYCNLSEYKPSVHSLGLQPGFRA